jgi:hypothetical protein
MRPEALDLLERLRVERPSPPPDPAQVQGELHTYLLERGRRLAQDMDLGHVQDQDLIRLAELDCIAQYHYAPPAVALHLAMLADQAQGKVQTAPETHTNRIARADRDRLTNGIDPGQVDHQWRAVPKNQQGKHEES